MYTSDYPVTNSVTYEFTTSYNTTIRYTAQDGNFDNVQVWIGSGSDLLFTVHDDDDLEFWQAVVHYHLETGGATAPAYSNADLLRAAQACILLGQIPGFAVLNDLIGYETAHGFGPADYDVMYKNVKAYKEAKSSPKFRRRTD